MNKTISTTHFNPKSLYYIGGVTALLQLATILTFSIVIGLVGEKECAPMKPLVIYDSKYGHTEKIARAIGEAISGQVIHVSEVDPATLKEYAPVIIGSPTHGGFPTEGIHNLVKSAGAFKGVDVAAFDTRTKMTIFGYAAPKIAKNLGKNGGKLLVQPEGFFVLATEGPLLDGELERAMAWGASLTQNAKGA